ncbi:MAG: DUF2461 domain-containing protein [Bacteroidota bacterium]|nr:DUF2461 domain-containing protein [Bacteroidota bacterium]
MLAPNTLHFLNELHQHNNRLWFDAHREAYQIAMKDMQSFTSNLITALTPIDPSLEGLEAKACIFRLFRDVRFSKNKLPYKTNLAAYLAKGGRKSERAGFYFHFEPNGKSFFGAGIWMPEAPVLHAIRQEIDYNWSEFNQLVNKASFKKLFPTIEGERLKKAPKGYAIDHPAVAYLQLKSFLVTHPIPDALLTQKELLKTLQRYCVAAKPFLDFLNRNFD